MKMPALLSMPSPAPASEALPPLPTALATALDQATDLLSARSRLTELLAAQTQSIPELIRNKIGCENRLASAETDSLLDETTDSQVHEIREELATVERSYKTANGIRVALRQRLLDQEHSLSACKDAITSHLEPYTQSVVMEFEQEYRDASAVFAAVLGKGAQLSLALRIHIDMPPPTPSNDGAADMGDAGRIGAVLDALTAACNSAANDRLQQARDSNRRAPYFAVGAVWELNRHHGPFAPGMWISSPLVSEIELEKLYLVKACRRVSADEVAMDNALADTDSAVTAQ